MEQKNLQKLLPCMSKCGTGMRDTKSRVRGENTAIFSSDAGVTDVKNGSVGFLYSNRLLETQSRLEIKCKI